MVMTNSSRRRVVRRHRAERLHVGAVPGLGHREAAHQLAGHQVGDVGVVVGLGAELEDRSAEQAELHPHLHQHREVSEGERLERSDRGTDVAPTPVLRGETHPGLAGRGHRDHEVADPVAEVVGRHRLRVHEHVGGLGEIGAHQLPDLGVLAVEEGRECGDVDVGLGIRLGAVGRGRQGVGGHVENLLRRCLGRGVRHPRSGQGRAKKFGAVQEYIDSSTTGRPVRGAWIIWPPPT